MKKHTRTVRALLLQSNTSLLCLVLVAASSSNLMATPVEAKTETSTATTTIGKAAEAVQNTALAAYKALPNISGRLADATGYNSQAGKAVEGPAQEGQTSAGVVGGWNFSTVADSAAKTLSNATINTQNSLAKVTGYRSGDIVNDPSARTNYNTMTTSLSNAGTSLANNFRSDANQVKPATVEPLQQNEVWNFTSVVKNFSDSLATQMNQGKKVTVETTTDASGNKVTTSSYTDPTSLEAIVKTSTIAPDGNLTETYTVNGDQVSPINAIKIDEISDNLKNNLAADTQVPSTLSAIYHAPGAAYNAATGRGGNLLSTNLSNTAQALAVGTEKVITNAPGAIVRTAAAPVRVLVGGVAPDALNAAGNALSTGASAVWHAPGVAARTAVSGIKAVEGGIKAVGQASPQSAYNAVFGPKVETASAANSATGSTPTNAVPAENTAGNASNTPPPAPASPAPGSAPTGESQTLAPATAAGPPAPKGPPPAYAPLTLATINGKVVPAPRSLLNPYFTESNYTSKDLPGWVNQ